MLAKFINLCRVLFAMAKVGFAMYLAYPAGVAMVFVSYPIVILMYRFVFGAIYAGRTDIATYDLSSILTYVTISWILNTFYMTPTGRRLGRQVREGSVAMDLIKPVNLMAIYFGQSLGRTAFRVLFATIPLAVVFAALGTVNPPDTKLLGYFLLAVLCGYLLNFQIDYLIGLLAFYLEYNNGIRWGIRMILSIAGGMVIPLNYFPEPVHRVFALFPTQFMFYRPMQIYLGRMSAEEAAGTVLMSLAWLAGLFIACQLLQYGGERRLSVSGG